MHGVAGAVGLEGKRTRYRTQRIAGTRAALRGLDSDIAMLMWLCCWEVYLIGGDVEVVWEDQPLAGCGRG